MCRDGRLAPRPWRPPAAARSPAWRPGSPPTRSGELLLRGEYVMLGYLDDPEATAEAIDADGWLHTGDVGTLDDAGNLTITDRLKDMYISGGFNVYPAEVEQALLRLDGRRRRRRGRRTRRADGRGRQGVRRGAAERRRSPPTTWSPSPRSGWPTSRCRGRSSSSTRSPATSSGKVLKTELRDALMNLDPVRVRAGLPGRGARLAGGQRAGRAAAVDGHRRGLRRAPGVGGEARRRPLVGRLAGPRSTAAAGRRWSSG